MNHLLNCPFSLYIGIHKKTFSPSDKVGIKSYQTKKYHAVESQSALISNLQFFKFCRQS